MLARHSKFVPMRSILHKTNAHLCADILPADPEIRPPCAPQPIPWVSKVRANQNPEQTRLPSSAGIGALALLDSEVAVLPWVWLRDTTCKVDFPLKQASLSDADRRQPSIEDSFRR